MQEYVDQMPVGCFLAHAYDPIPLEFREQERIGQNNELERCPNPIGEAHSLFYHESDIISRAEVRMKNICECVMQPKTNSKLQIWASEALPHYFSNRQPLVSRLWLWRMMLLCSDSDSKLKEVVEVRFVWRRLMLKNPHTLLQFGEVFFDAAFETHAVALSARNALPNLLSLSEARAPSAKPNTGYQDRPRCAFIGCSYYGTAAQSGYCSFHFKQQVSAAAAPSTMVAQASAPAQEQVLELSGAGMATAPSIEKPDVQSNPTDTVMAPAQEQVLELSGAGMATAPSIEKPDVQSHATDSAIAPHPPSADDGTVLVSNA
jgi:hypothetical protein